MQHEEFPPFTVGFSLCVSGELVIETHMGQTTLRSGMLCLFSPMIRIVEVGRSADCRLEHFETPLENVYTLFSKIEDSLPRLSFDVRPYVQLTSECQRSVLNLRDAVLRRRAEWQGCTDELSGTILRHGVCLMEQTLMAEVLVAFAKEREREPVDVSSIKRRVAFRFLLLLAMNFKRHRDVEFYAKEVGMTASYFARLLKLQTGHTPMEVIHTMTCTAARDMLASTDMSVKQIACALGFPEQFTFRKYFKKHVGKSPSEYRRGIDQTKVLIGGSDSDQKNVLIGGSDPDQTKVLRGG